MSGLPWVRFDTDFPDNPKVLDLVARRGGGAAAFVYCCGLAYAGRHGTDGHIPPAALARIHGRRTDAAHLVAVGLWDPDPDDRGWWIHDWADYQQPAKITDDILARKRAGAAKGNCIRWHGSDCGCWKRLA